MDFARVNVNLPLTVRRQLGHDEVLIMPSHLHKLNVSVKKPGHRTQFLRASVAGNMRLRSVVHQILGSDTSRVDVYVQLRNTWKHVGLDTRLDAFARVGGGYGLHEMSPRLEIYIVELCPRRRV